MKFLGKPQNRWGWARAAGLVTCAAILVWTLLAAVLRGMGAVTWMAWSGYPNFSLLDGLELAAAALLAVVISGWLEEHDARVEDEQARHRETERAAAAQRKETLRRLHEVLQVELHGANHVREGGEMPAQARLKINQAVRAALPDLDGKGKGELLGILYETGLLTSEKPVLDWYGADLGGTQLNGAHLAGAQLAGADLSKAFLRQADLRGAGLAGCSLARARLENATLAGADLTEARLDGAFLMNANLKDARFDGSFDLAVLIDTILPDGQKVTNAKGKAYLQNKEIATLVDRL